jgi:hypothetical protein
MKDKTIAIMARKHPEIAMIPVFLKARINL